MALRNPARTPARFHWTGVLASLLLLAAPVISAADPENRGEPDIAAPDEAHSVLASGAEQASAGEGDIEEQHTAGRYNILLITIDTLRADHLGCYGYSRMTTPTIDRLAEEGLLFEYAFVPRGGTWTSLTTMHTSLYPVTHGVRNNGYQPVDGTLFLAEVLKERGYATGAMLANAGELEWEGFDDLVYAKYDDRRVTRKGIQWLEQHRAKRFFLWLHYFEPHAPYQPGPHWRDMFVDPAYGGKLTGSMGELLQITASKRQLAEGDLEHIINLYDADIRFDDDQVLQVLNALRHLGLMEETLIVFAADHGEDLYEHNKYFFHSASLHENVLRIPLIFRLPGVVPAGGRHADVVESISLAPTILDLAGVESPSAFQGNSLAPAFRGEALPETFAFAELLDKITAIRDATHRYILNPLKYAHRTMTENMKRKYEIEQDPHFPVEEEELYAPLEDPAEQRNLVHELPERAASLRESLLARMEQYNWKYDSAAPAEIDPELKATLEALGYVP